MRHAETKTVFGLWSALKGRDLVPSRQAIEPRQFARHLSQICLLEMAGPDASVRLAGTSICTWFGRELKGVNFGALWSRAGRLSIQAALARVFTLGRAMVVEALGETEDGRQIGIEVLLMPLRDGMGEANLILAYAQPLDPLSRLGGQALAGLRFVGMGEAIPPRPDRDGGPGAPTVGEPKVKAAPRAHLRLVVSNAMRSGLTSLFARPRPDAALGLVT